MNFGKICEVTKQMKEKLLQSYICTSFYIKLIRTPRKFQFVNIYKSHLPTIITFARACVHSTPDICLTIFTTVIQYNEKKNQNN